MESSIIPIILELLHKIINYTKSCVSPCLFRTYADKLSPKVVQSLLDLLCSQLKNLLSQAGVNLLSSAKDQEDSKHEDSADTEKKDFRGDKKMLCTLQYFVHMLLKN